MNSGKTGLIHACAKKGVIPGMIGGDSEKVTDGVRGADTRADSEKSRSWNSGGISTPKPPVVSATYF